jgi:hypothetical protein
LVLALVLVGWCGPVRAQSFEDGLRAFRGGEPGRARDIWLPLAEAGDADAQHSLGKLFERGEGSVAQDLAKAVHWYRAAAAQGLPAAQNNLGLMYAQGRGVPTDLTRAIEIWRAAAQQRYPWSQYNLGLAFYRGQGVAVDRQEAAFWFRQAADGGLAEAQFIMGQLRREGLGLQKDEGRALTWYRRAADQGHARAQRHAELLTAAGFEPTLPETSVASTQGESAGRQDPASATSRESASTAESPRVATSTLAPPSGKTEAAPEAGASDSGRPATQAPPELQSPTPKSVAILEVEEAPSMGANVGVATEPRPQAEAVPTPKSKPLVVSRRQPTATAEPDIETTASPPAALQDLPQPEAPADSGPVMTKPLVSDQDGEEMAEPETTGTETRGAFRIWLASARNRATATKLWETVRDRHPEVFAGTEATFAEVDLGERTLVRVLVGPLASMQSAEGLCERLRGVDPGAFCKVRSAWH